MKNIEKIFQEISSQEPFRIEELKKWTEKYKSFFLNKSLQHNVMESCMDRYRFTSLYEQISEVINFHQWENYTEIEINALKQLMGEKFLIKDWLIKNEKLGNDDLCLFLINYLDYSDEESEIEHLLITTDRENQFSLFVNRQDFKNLIEFKERFDYYYYVKEYHLEEIEKV